MKNNVEAGPGKDQRSDHAFFASLTPSRLLVGVVSFTLLLISSVGAIAVVTNIHAISVGATLATNVVTKPTLFPNDTSKPTRTPSPVSTSTPVPTPTTTKTPTSTPTSMPSPTSTSLSSPTPTSTTAPKPIPTSTATATPSLSPTDSSNTTPATATPGATSTETTMPAQSSSQGQTPTTSSTSDTIQSASQDRQNRYFPFIVLAIGIPGAIAAIGFFFIGWWLLRKRLLPVKNVKLPPSGADPWSRVRASDTPWNMNVNGNTQPFSNNNQLSSDPIFWGHTSVVPTLYGSGQTYPQNYFAPGSHLSINGSNHIHNAPAMPGPAKPGVNEYQAIGNNVNASYRREEDAAYQQWLRNNPERTQDLNNPYLKELIKQYSDKSRTARNQKLSNTSNEQASSTQKR